MGFCQVLFHLTLIFDLTASNAEVSTKCWPSLENGPDKSSVLVQVGFTGGTQPNVRGALRNTSKSVVATYAHKPGEAVRILKKEPRRHSEGGSSSLLSNGEKVVDDLQAAMAFESKQRRVHISITGRLDCQTDAPYGHLEEMVSKLEVAGHKVLLYIEVTYVNMSTQLMPLQRLMDGVWGSRIMWKEVHGIETDEKYASNFSQQHTSICSKFPPNICVALISNMQKLRHVWSAMSREVRPGDIVIRTRPNLVMTPASFVWGDALPIFARPDTCVVSALYGYFKDGIEDNFAIMTRDAAAVYYTIADRVDDLLNPENKLWPSVEVWWGYNLRSLDVVYRNWSYLLEGDGGHHHRRCSGSGSGQVHS